MRFALPAHQEKAMRAHIQIVLSAAASYEAQAGLGLHRVYDHALAVSTVVCRFFLV